MRLTERERELIQQCRDYKWRGTPDAEAMAGLVVTLADKLLTVETALTEAEKKD